MLLFKPAIWREGELYELPRPVTTLRLLDAWDAERMKVPLRDGDLLAGHSRQGVDIAIEGQIASQAGTLRLTEEEMFLELDELRTRLNVAAGESPYEFFLYHDPATETFRSFRNCSTVRFEYDLSDARLFTYAITLHAADPVIHEEPPE
jgi:hypothetical protein